MTPPPLRLLRPSAPHLVIDRSSGLEWDLNPAGSPGDWETAVRGGVARSPWRLPTLTEVLDFVGVLPVAWLPAGIRVPGGHVWTATESPFAPVTMARAVSCEGEGRFAVVLLQKSAATWWWLVRPVEGRHDAPPPVAGTA